jgi:hypothetical protein
MPSARRTLVASRGPDDRVGLLRLRCPPRRLAEGRDLMGINAISWRRIQTLNEQLGERFVHVYTYSHHKHWYWTGMRIDGTTATIDTRNLTVEEDEYDEKDLTSTQRLLRDRSTATEHDLEWLAMLDERAAHLASAAGQ